MVLALVTRHLVLFCSGLRMFLFFPFFPFVTCSSPFACSLFGRPGVGCKRRGGGGGGGGEAEAEAEDGDNEEEHVTSIVSQWGKYSNASYFENTYQITPIFHANNFTV